MPSRRALAAALQPLAGFRDPSATLEQYGTDADVAAAIVHEARLRGDLEGTVVDLGCGTGLLGIGAALAGATRVVGIDVDAAAVATAVANAARAGVDAAWFVGDVAIHPLCPPDGTTVLMNPPFGAHLAERGADRAFLATAASIADVSYSVHNAGSDAFVRAFADDRGGSVTHAFAVELTLPHQFPHHQRDAQTIDAEVHRTVWDAQS